MIVFQLWFWRTLSLNFHTYLLNSSICVRKSLLQILARSHWQFLYLRMFGERSTAKNYCLVSPSVVCKVFGKLVNNRVVDHLEKYGIFTNFYFRFRSSWSSDTCIWVWSCLRCNTWYIQGFWKDLTCCCFPQTYVSWNFRSDQFPEFLKTWFLVQKFSWYTFVTFLMLSVILLSDQASHLWQSFFLLRLPFMSIYLPYSFSWNVVVISWVLLLAATWNCYRNYKTNI